MNKKRGQSLIEYMLIVALISLGVTSGITMLGKNENKTFGTVNDTMSTAVRNAEEADLATKNAKTVGQHTGAVSAGQKQDVPQSGNTGSTSWTNPTAPTGNKPPIAKFKIDPVTPTSDNTITFLDLSTDPDGDDIVKEEWQNKKDKYPAGQHTVKLRVADSKGNWSAWYQTTITVGNGRPVVTKIIPNPNTTTILPDTNMTFTAEASDPDGQTLTYIWDNVKTNYPLGEHEVTVRAKDSGGLTSEPFSITIKVVQVEEGKYKSCLDVKNNYPLAKDGTFKVNPNGTVVSVYCDMTTNGGGWTRISNYDIAANPNATAGGLIRASGWTGNYAGSPPNAWWAHFNTISGMNYQQRQVILNTEQIEYSSIRMEYKFITLWSLDSWANTHGGGFPDRTTVEGQYMDGISITYGVPGSRKHLLSVTATTAPPESRLSWIGSNYAGGTNPTGIMTRSLPSKTKEPIELRFMADQNYPDEDVGMQELVTWVK